jgi:hypothetical protein
VPGQVWRPGLPHPAAAAAVSSGFPTATTLCSAALIATAFSSSHSTAFFHAANARVAASFPVVATSFDPLPCRLDFGAQITRHSSLERTGHREWLGTFLVS